MQEIKEEWRDIPGYEGYYQVSNLGRVRSLDRIIHIESNHRNKSYDKFKKGYVLNPGYTTQYLFVNLSKDNNQKQMYIHRLVAMTFLPNPENKKDVNHINGIKTDNVVTNLEWATRKENMRHAYNNNLVGYNNPQNKKRVRVISPDGEEKDFDCIEDAAKFLGVYASGVSRAASGVRKHIKHHKVQYV